jgi:uncharacterized protein YndB with AHSA1/START domain
MSTNRRVMQVSPGSVWRALADGYSYADWVVGTREIRDVDAGFPATGSRLHYTVGHGPLRHTGHTEVVSAEPERCLELKIHAWPVVAVRVLIMITGRSEREAEVTMTEHPARGPVALLHNPLSDLALKLRNVETLRRLERVARLHGGHVDQR